MELETRKLVLNTKKYKVREREKMFGCKYNLTFFHKRCDKIPVKLYEVFSF